MILRGETLDAGGPLLSGQIRPASVQALGINAAERAFLKRLPDGGLQVR